MSVESLFDYIKQDHELRCNLSLAQFLNIKIGQLILLYRGKERVSEDLIQTMLNKTDLTEEEINAFLNQ